MALNIKNEDTCRLGPVNTNVGLIEDHIEFLEAGEDSPETLETRNNLSISLRRLYMWHTAKGR